MKSLFAFATLLTLSIVSQSSLATTRPEYVSPDIQCELRVYKVDKDGMPALGSPSREFNVSSQGGGTSLDGFKAKAHLSPLCAADGGPCSGYYDLNVETSSGKVSTTSGKQVLGYDTSEPRSAIPGQSNYQSTLRIGSDEAYVACTILGK
jgi:hypothetical protein